LFKNADSGKMRPWDDIDKMDADLIQNWNDTVSPDDRVYLLGDVTFTAANMKKYIPQLNGRICLIPGNHEPTKMRKYFDLFDDVRGYVQRKGFIMSHIPLHPESMARWGLNIHGHLHANKVRNADGTPDLRYYCVSMEHTDYRPIDLNEILERHNRRVSNPDQFALGL
jgi:calcineurin-like phosphoesterase family protein